MTKQTITIEYSAEQDKNFDKAYRSQLYLNGKWRYTTARCKKTMRGALNQAKKMAKQLASDYPALYNDVTISQRK